MKLLDYKTVRPTVKQTTNYEYEGNAVTSVTSQMAQDQFYRADLNPNKEIIAQGREPTPKIRNYGMVAIQ